MDRIFFFKKIPLFEKLSPTDLKQVAMIAEESMFTDGETFAEEGEHGDVMYVIVSGKVKVATADANEKTEVVLAERGVGDYVGEMSLINSEPRIASLTAIGTVRTLCLNQKSFLDLLRERPDVGMALIRVLSLRLKEANELIEKISPKTPTFIKKRTS
jgi:CRP-like cAMP-binding protein